MNKNKNKNTRPRSRKTLGQKSADKIAKWAGSWTFILSLLFIIALWIYLNLAAFVNNWDPWPFIILNLCLSCLAAMHAPIILMSQNRQAQRDRLKADYDYQIDKKAEREIREITKQLNRIERRMMK
jgi:uncharacterized membrane protein